MIARLRRSPLGARARMLGALPRLARRDDHASRAIATALKTTALGRGGPGEEAWIARIEARRRSLAAKQTVTQGGFDVEPAHEPGWAAQLDRPVPMSVASSMFSIPPVWGRFLMRLVRELEPGSCLELGTGFGISAAYQAAPLELAGGGRLTTLDGATEWMRTAQEGFSELGLTTVEAQPGLIGETLAPTLERIAPIDYAFVDAEHQEAPTLAYFEAMLPHLSPGAALVFDDIQFSDGMKRAWAALQRHPRVSTAVGLGRMGVVVVSGPASHRARKRAPLAQDSRVETDARSLSS